MFIRKPFAAVFLLFTALTTATFAGVNQPDPGLLDSAFSQHAAGPQWLSAINVAVSGRIKTPEGRPIKGASITLKDANTNALVRGALSSTFGYYKLDQIESGRMYVLSVSHKRYLFAFPASLMEINEDRTDVDFTGEPAE